MNDCHPKFEVDRYECGREPRRHGQRERNGDRLAQSLTQHLVPCTDGVRVKTLSRAPETTTAMFMMIGY